MTFIILQGMKANVIVKIKEMYLFSFHGKPIQANRQLSFFFASFFFVVSTHPLSTFANRRGEDKANTEYW